MRPSIAKHISIFFFAKHISNKSIKPKVYKEFLKLNSKKKTTQFKKMGKISE